MSRTIKELADTVGGLSKPSKMPGLSYGTPAADCKVGSILRAIGKKTVCGSCYAHKGMYVFPNVKKAQARRLAILSGDLASWTKNMTELLSRKYSKKLEKDKIFRWHDSGDIQSEEHFAAIVQIAKDLPDIKFWLPTKEYALMRKMIPNMEIPSNLVVRMSAPMVGKTAPAIPGTVSSTVDTPGGWDCPAPSQGGECRDCRACWNPDIERVNYHKH